MSTPQSMGRVKAGVATVLSTITGTPWLWAMSEYRVVYDNGYSVAVGHVRDGLQVGDIASRVSDRLAVHSRRLVIDELGEVLG